MKFESKLECKNLKIKLLFAEQLDLDILKDESIDIDSILDIKKVEELLSKK